jgi:Ca-activated chloride channel family protein
MNLDQLIRQVSLTGANAGSGVKIFTIAYGSNADQDGLTKIANAAGGKEYAGTPQNIQSVYNQISQFF